MSLFNFNKENKEKLIESVIQRSGEAYSRKSGEDLEQLLEEMIFWEKKRISRVERFWRRERKIAHWDNYKESYLKASDEGKKKLLTESIDFYTRQIVGNFSPAVFHFSTKVIPPFLRLLFNALSLQRLFSFTRSTANENIVLSGNISLLQKLSQEGTLIFAPTHISNLDSIVLGAEIERCGLPPVMYGAGLNLFRNKFIGFFMHNLGAYKVDRLRVHTLYKDILKEYAASSIQMGFHNLFFPGGTRSRSGAVEKHLKMGLLGTGLTAFVRNVQEKKSKPNIYIIPVNLNSHLTLEAETLIHDFLAAMGQSRYIIEDDEFSKPRRIFQYIRDHMRLNSKAFIHFGDPLDPFGNRVDEMGQSVDLHGRPIDIVRYIQRDGEVLFDADRDRNYTLELSSVLLDQFHRKNRVLTTHLVAFTLYEMIARKYPGVETYKLLRTHAYDRAIDLQDLYRELDRVSTFLKQLSDQGRIVYSDYLRTMDMQDIVNGALQIFSTYHKRHTIYRKGDKIFVGDLPLLYYYHNRLVGYNVEDMLGEA